MKRLPAILLTLLTLTYPALVYIGLLHFSVQWVGTVITALLVLRLLILRKNLGSEIKTSLAPAIILAIGCASIATALNHAGALKLIPVVINLACLSGFAATLYRPPSMIERFARLQEPELSCEAIAYTRKVTQVWCVFFVLNGAVALYTALFADMKIWTLYNGLIAYLLMGLLFAVEYLVRLRVKAKIRSHTATSHRP
ncbi:MAG: hypothetical protein IT470_08275 [Pseudomonadales bacterium]|nr:hypothetical protein [Pseudomonadales bacterium]